MKMNIKTRLLVTFSVLILLVVIMGSILIAFGLRSKQLSQQSIQNYSRLFFWREIGQLFDQQWRSLNYYVVLGDMNEYDKFWDQSKKVEENFQNVKDPEPVITEWHEMYSGVNKVVRESVEGGSRDQLFEAFSGDLSAKSDELQKKAADAVKHHMEVMDVLDKAIRQMGMISVIISVVMGAAAVIMGGLMSAYIFRSIAHPLGVLQKGTKIIGDGNFDYQIPTESNDEIGQLAKSFNLMVNNLRTLQLQVVQMDRMSSIGQLAGGVAHEINNPLTGVLGQAQLLLEKLPADHPHRHTIERIESAAQRCRRIVRALLDFARDKNYKFLPVSIADLMIDTIGFTHSDLNSKKIVLKNEVSSTLPQISVSAGHLQQVFLNIINNAIHAMPQGGTLTITAQQSFDKYLEIVFRDTGIGIKKEHLSHVFDPFFTTKDIGKGTGLGLTISYGIVQRHKGEILVASEGEGKGAVFTVRLPLNPEIPPLPDA